MSVWEDEASTAIPRLSDGWGGFSVRPSRQYPKMLWPPRQGEGCARLCCQAELSADGPGQQLGKRDSYFPMRRLAWQLRGHADKGTPGPVLVPVL